MFPPADLAVIFQPGIFSHPSHLQDANEHKMAVEVLEFLIEHQDFFVLRLSNPKPTKIEGLDLTTVSSVKPTFKAKDFDVAEPSDSDEDLGELTVHEGGGAKLARRSTSSSAGERKVSGGRFRRKKGTAIDRVATVEGAGSVESEGRISQSTETSTTKPSSPKGELVEMEAGLSSSAQPAGGGLRRSRTTPSRRSNDEKRSVSSGKTKIKRDAAAAAPTTSKSSSSAEQQDAKPVAEEAAIPADLASTAETSGNESKEENPETGLPTPPSSKLLDVPATERQTSSMDI
jgi:hypothetical protein